MAFVLDTHPLAPSPWSLLHSPGLKVRGSRPAPIQNMVAPRKSPRHEGVQFETVLRVLALSAVRFSSLTMSASSWGFPDERPISGTLQSWHESTTDTIKPPRLAGVRFELRLTQPPAPSPVRLSSPLTMSGPLPAFPGERPTVGAMRSWLEAATDVLTPDQRALTEGYATKGEIQYAPDRVPPVMLAGDTASHAMVASRQMSIMQVEDKNARMAAQLGQHKAELANEFHQLLVRFIRPAAPLLVDKMIRENALTAFPKYHDGLKFWNHLRTMAEAVRMLPGEDRRHDIAFSKAESAPLSDGASAAAFAQRVNTLMREHIPYLSRTFDSEEALAKWVTTQVPNANRQEARNR